MTSILAINPQQAHQAMTNILWPWVKSMTTAGHELVIEGRLREDKKSDQQRKFLHGVILTEIARQAKPAYPMAVWKEYLRSEFLGKKRVTVINPITGKKTRRYVRISTEDLGVKAYSEFIERVISFGVTELGVEFSQRRWQDFVDPETGEIMA